MDAKEALEKAIKDVKTEWEWLLLESRWIQKLKYAVKIGDYSQIRRFERKAARSERRINRFEEKVIEILNFLRQKFPSWGNILADVEEKTKIYNRNILKRVSLIDGTIPNLIKQNNYSQINIEIDSVMNEGIRPLDILLIYLQKELKKALEKNIIAEQIREEELPQKMEDYLKQQPFLVIFHSANEKEYVNNILASRYDLPESYLGRRVEYAFEVDYFWIKHNGKISGYLGHALAWMTPRNSKKIMDMYRGKTNAESMLKRKGLILPEWFFSRIGKIKLMVEIKGGWGSDEEGLDELVRMIKSYHLENSIILFGFSPWPLAYLKQRLPRALTVIILVGNLALPLNNFLKSFGLNFGRDKFLYVDIIDKRTKESEKWIMEQVKKVAENKKFFIGGKVDSKEKFDLLVKHGAKGALVWKDPKTILEWLAHPSYAKETAKQRSMAFKPI